MTERKHHSPESREKHHSPEPRDERRGKEDETRMLSGMFPDRERTERAYKRLGKRGYTRDEINLMMTDETREKYFGDEARDDTIETEVGNKALEGTGAGASIGGAAGAAIGVVAAIGTSIAIPGLGIIVAGPLAGALAGAGAGGITGGIIGALIGAGLPEERAKEYQDGLKNGRILMTVHPRNEQEARELEAEWEDEYSGEEVHYTHR